MAEPIAPPPHLTFYHTMEYAPGRRIEGWPVIVPIVDDPEVMEYWDGQSDMRKLRNWQSKRG
jgi:hypothetical protein